MVPILKLTYFDIRGRAESIRLALHVGGIPFTDERLPRDEAMALIADGGLPFFALPVMEVNGEMHAQSLALLRYAGRLSGLYPEDPADALSVDEVLDASQDVGAAIAAAAHGSPALRSACADTLVKKYLTGTDRIFGAREGPFLLGDNMSIADLSIYVFRIMIEEKFVPFLDTAIFDGLKHLQASYEAVVCNEKIAEWMEVHGRVDKGPMMGNSA